MDSFFYTNIDNNILDDTSKKFINIIQEYSNENFKQITMINKPLIDPKFEYEYDLGGVLLIPGYKCVFIDFGNNSNKFEEFKEDFLEDLGYISEKFSYKKILGRPREWKREFFEDLKYSELENINFNQKLEYLKFTEEEKIRISEMIISLLIGSINQIEKIFCENNVPQDLLERVKKKIILFDADQTRFIYQEPRKKRILIQGLAGTGKTELLLHKLKDLYLTDSNSKIAFTCFNKILAQNLKTRINDFFDFMKVEEQIKWNERLWTISSWGSQNSKNSGVYSYICQFYKIPFYAYYETKSFKLACIRAIEELKKIEECVEDVENSRMLKDGKLIKCFDYILIDEGQDFPEEFFELCEMVTEKSVYVAGDIFQNIFDKQIIGKVSPDFLLNKCYRTDPRTLMFAQGLGMGLFDKNPPLRWLKDEEWNACGYNIDRKINEQVILSRIPLRRFEDLKDFESMKLIGCNEDKYLDNVIEIIENIKKEYKSVLPDDIAIIFLEERNINNYNLANKLSIIMKDKYDWDVNKGYETKAKINNTLFISNRNNVKGLEFPFVICLTRNPISDSIKIRNSIYMMLTRSFLTSYFIIPNEDTNITKYKEGLDGINIHGILKVVEPSEEEKTRIMDIIINSENINKSINEIVDEIIIENNISYEKHKKVHEIVNAFIGENEEWSKELIEKIISLNKTLL